MKIAANGLVFIVVGLLVGLGMKAVDWLIPRPPAELNICVVDKVSVIEKCMTLSELRKEAQP